MNLMKKKVKKKKLDVDITKKKKRKKHPPLTKAQQEFCPYGTNKCRICRLLPNEIEIIHDLRSEKKYSHTKLGKYIRKNMGIKVSPNEVGEHLNKHVDDALSAVKVYKGNPRGKQKKISDIARVLNPMDHAIQAQTGAEVEKAYQSLVRMAGQYTTRVEDLQNEITKIIKNKDIPSELTGLSAIELLDRLAKLNREASAQIKTVSGLRAPRIMVAQTLETFIDGVISEMSVLLNNLCGEINFAVIEKLKEHKVQETIPQTVFTELFQKVALDYKKSILYLKRQTLTNALSALQDMEKVI